jgi:hypothetical protein
MMNLPPLPPPPLTTHMAQASERRAEGGAPGLSDKSMRQEPGRDQDPDGARMARFEAQLLAAKAAARAEAPRRTLPDEPTEIGAAGVVPQVLALVLPAGPVSLRLDPGPNRLGMTAITLAFSPAALVVTITLAPGSAAQDLMSAMQGLAQALSIRYPGRVVRLERDSRDDAETSKAQSKDAPAFDPLNPLRRRP